MVGTCGQWQPTTAPSALFGERKRGLGWAVKYNPSHSVGERRGAGGGPGGRNNLSHSFWERRGVVMGLAGINPSRSIGERRGGCGREHWWVWVGP